MSRILSTGGVGVCLSACWDTTSPAGTPWEQTPPPRTRHPLGADTPPGPGNPPATRHSPAQCMLSYTVNERAVCILLECNLVNTIFQQCCLGLMLVDGFQTDSKACTQCESPLVVIVTICLFLCRYRGVHLCSDVLRLHDVPPVQETNQRRQGNRGGGEGTSKNYIH